jgi:predicted RNA-binding protein YlqC (UPF0109 family)
MATILTDETCPAMVSLVREMVFALVDEPEQVSVTELQRDGCLVMDVVVAPGDVGKVIGKQGRTARSLRTILSAASMKAKIRCELNIYEYPRGGEEKGAA